MDEISISTYFSSGHGLIAASGERWRHQRAFTAKFLNDQGLGRGGKAQARAAKQDRMLDTVEEFIQGNTKIHRLSFAKKYAYRYVMC